MDVEATIRDSLDGDQTAGVRVGLAPWERRAHFQWPFSSQVDYTDGAADIWDNSVHAVDHTVCGIGVVVGGACSASVFGCAWVAPPCDWRCMFCGFDPLFESVSVP